MSANVEMSILGEPQLASLVGRRISTALLLSISAIAYMFIFMLFDIFMSSLVGAPLTFDEAAQSLNINVAPHVANRIQPLLIDGRVTEEVISNLSYFNRLNPALVPYVLDGEGAVIASPKDIIPRRAKIDIGPLTRLLRHPVLRLRPVFGEDPESPDSETVFSVAPVFIGSKPGYVYIIIRSQYRTWVDYRELTKTFIVGYLPLIPALIIMFLFVLFLFSRQLLANLRQLTASAIALARGDRTARAEVHSRDELGFIAASFNSMAQLINNKESDLTDLEQKRRYLVATILHDIRAPTTVMKGYIDLLLERGERMPFAEQVRYMDRVRESSVRQEQLLTALKELSSYEFNSDNILREDLSLAGLAQDTVQHFQHAAAQRGIELSFAGEAECHAIAERASIVRVLANLVNNAIAHTPAGGKIVVTTARGNGAALCEVLDSGEGIAEQDIPHVFEIFYRGTDAQSSEKPGSGLGLSIVKSIISAHGGEIRVQSTKGKGTLMSFTLPDVGRLEARERLDVEQASSSPRPPAAQNRARAVWRFGFASLSIGLILYSLWQSYPAQALGWCAVLGTLIWAGSSSDDETTAFLPKLSAAEGLVLGALHVFLNLVQEESGMAAATVILSLLANTKRLGGYSRTSAYSCALAFYGIFLGELVAQMINETMVIGIAISFVTFGFLWVAFTTRNSQRLSRRLSITINGSIFWVACVALYCTSNAVFAYQYKHQSEERRYFLTRTLPRFEGILGNKNPNSVAMQLWDIGELLPSVHFGIANSEGYVFLSTGIEAGIARYGQRLARTLSLPPCHKALPVLYSYLFPFSADFAFCLTKEMQWGFTLAAFESNISGRVLRRTIELHSFGGIVLAVLKILILGGFFAIVVNHFIGRPLERIREVIEETMQGSFKARAAITGTYEIAIVAASLNNMLDSLNQRIQERGAADDRRRFLIDALVQTLEGPSNAIIAAARHCSELLQTNDKGALAAGLQRAQQAITNQLIVAEDIFKLSQLEIGDTVPEKAPCEMYDLVESAKRPAGVQVQTLPVAEDIPLVLGDVALLSRAVPLLVEAMSSLLPFIVVEAAERNGRIELTLSKESPSATGISERIEKDQLSYLLPAANPFRLSAAEKILELHGIALFARKSSDGLNAIILVFPTAAA